MMRVGQCEVWPDKDVIVRDGAEIAVTPKSMDVLTYLAERPGATVSANELLEAVWANSFIADNAVHKAVSELRQAFDDDHQNPQYIRTIRARGYALVAQVQPTAAVTPRVMVWPAWVAALVLVVLAGWWLLAPSSESVVSRPSIAVIGFAERDPRAGNAWLARGIGQSIAVGLYRAEFEVPPQQLIGFLRNQGATAVEIGQHLDVDYVLSGSVEVHDGIAVVDAVLTDPQSGQPYWTERFERPMGEVFELEDRIAANIVARLLGTSGNKPVSFDRGTNSDAAYVAYLEAMSPPLPFCFNFERRLAALRKAVALDPEFAKAKAYLAIVMKNHAAFCSQNFEQLQAAERAMQEVLTDGGLEPFFRAVLAVNLFSPPYEVDPSRILDEYGEIAALGREEYTERFQNPVESLGTLEGGYAVMLTTAGLLEQAEHFAARSFQILRQRDGPSARIDANSTLRQLFLGNYERCLVDFGDLDSVPLLLDTNHPFSLARFSAIQCAAGAKRFDMLDDFTAYYEALLERAGELSLQMRLPEEVVRRELLLRLDHVDVERLVALGELGVARERYPPQNYLNDAFLGYRQRAIVARLGDPDTVFAMLNRYLDTGGDYPVALTIRPWFEWVRPDLLDDPRTADLFASYGVTDAWQDELCAAAIRVGAARDITISCPARE